MRTKTDGSWMQGLVRRLPAAGLAVFVFALYSCYSYFQWKHFITPSWDLGIFSQLAQDYAHFDLPPIVPIKGAGFNLWGDHFHPILILLGPIYALFPSPATLLYVQNGLIALSAYCLVRFAQRVLGTWWALVLGVAYSLSFGVQQAVAAQFHEVAFALPFLVLSLGHLVLAKIEDADTHLFRAVLWSLPVALVKEDMGMTVAVIGLLALVRSGWLARACDILFPRREKAGAVQKRRGSLLLQSLKKSWTAIASLLTLIFGATVSILAVAVILPAFNTGGVFDYADKLDVPGILADPLQSLGLMFYPWQKSLTWLMLLLVGAFAWVFSPLALVLLPTLVWRFLSPQESYWDATWHYSLVLMPMIFMALLDVIVWVHPRHHRSTSGDTATYRTVFSDIVHLFRRSSHVLLPLLTLLVALAMLPQQPLKDLADKNFATTEASAQDLAKEQVVEAIPAGTSVAADLSVLTYLVPNHEVYWIGHSGEPAPDYVIIDRLGTAWGGNPPIDPVGYAADRYGVPYQLDRQVGSITIVTKVR